MLKGAMTLRGDGVVEGEIKGQVFSLGEEELVRGEMGFEVVSDPEDDECEGNHDKQLGLMISAFQQRMVFGMAKRRYFHAFPSFILKCSNFISAQAEQAEYR